MIVLRMELGLLSCSLLLIVLISGASGCARTALKPRHHHHDEDSHPQHPHVLSRHSYHEKTEEYQHPNAIPTDGKYKRAISGYSTALLSTSCNRTLCARSPVYPIMAINHAVNDVRRILRSNDELDLQKKKSIDPIVVKYFSSLSNIVENYYLPEPDGCDHYLNVFLPEEGYSVDDEYTYYIVNLPSYRQRVESIMCSSLNDVCINDFVRSTCRQAYRVKKLLALPIDTEFDISDFRVKKFKVPNGCICSLSSNF